MKHLFKLLMLLVAFVAVSCEGEAPQDPTQFTVTFEANGGTETDPVTVNAGEKIAAPADPELADSQFLGWYTSDSYALKWNFAQDVVTKNITLYAKWKTTYSVSFNANGGTPEPATLTGIISGATISKPTEPTKTDYVFGGWYAEATLTTPWNFATSTVTSNTTLYAKWIETNRKFTYKFVYNNGDDDSAPVEVDAGAKITEPTKPTNHSHKFIGWSATDSADDIWDFETNTVTENVTLTAQWTMIYTVTFATNDSDYSVASETIANGERVQEPFYADEDKKIEGWYTDSDYETEYDFTNTAYTTNFTLYAKWAYSVDVSFMGENDVLYEKFNTYKGDKVSKPYPNPASTVHPYWTFAGWFTADDVEWDFNNPVTEEMTLYAKFEDKPIEVRVWLNYDQYYNNETYDNYNVYVNEDYNPNNYFTTLSGSTIPAANIPADPTSYTHTFVKWIVGEDTDWDFATSKVPSTENNFNIYAVWEPKGDGAAAKLYPQLPHKDSYTTESYTQGSVDALYNVVAELDRKIKSGEVTEATYQSDIDALNTAIENLVLRDFGATVSFEWSESYNLIYDNDGSLMFIEDWTQYVTLTAVDANGEITNAEISANINSGGNKLELTSNTFHPAPNGEGDTEFLFLSKTAGVGTIVFSTANDYSETINFKIYTRDEVTTSFYEIYNELKAKERLTPDDEALIDRACDLGNLINWDDKYEMEQELWNMSYAIPKVWKISNNSGVYAITIGSGDDEETMVCDSYTPDGAFPYGNFKLTVVEEGESYTVNFVLKSDGTCTAIFEEDGETDEEKSTFEIQDSSTATTKVLWIYEDSDNEDGHVDIAPTPVTPVIPDQNPDEPQVKASFFFAR